MPSWHAGSALAAAAAAPALLLLLLAPPQAAARGAAAAADPDSSWGGVNSFFLHALPAGDRGAYLDRMKEASAKVLRIFISATPADYKRTPSLAVKDLETDHVGPPYDDTILGMVDDLMLDAHQRGIKLDIALHDRYALGCYSRDAYVSTYDLPDGCCGCDTAKNQVDKFYTDPEIEAKFDERLVHILTHRNPHFQNRTWGELSDVVLSFSPENEAQGHDNQVDYGWWCRRAWEMRKHVSPGVLVSTGGSVDLMDAAHPGLFVCPWLDVVDIHTYTTDLQAITLVSQVATVWAVHRGKRVRLQEFGVKGDDWSKAAMLGQIFEAMNGLGVPFYPWELIDPEDNSDYEFWTEGEVWRRYSASAAAALRVAGPFAWAEVPGSGPGRPKDTWNFCTVNSECANGCCSREMSDDQKFKCTPGGKQCTGMLLDSWRFCTNNSDCANGCCSKQYSDDGRYKCTPGGAPNFCGEAMRSDGQSCDSNGACASGCCKAGLCASGAPPSACSGGAPSRQLRYV